MSSATHDVDSTPEYVTLMFRIKFHKNETVTAPDGPHALTIKCIKPNFLNYPIVDIGPLEEPGHHHGSDHGKTMLAEASENRALLAAALALFDAEFAKVLTGLAPPKPPRSDLNC